MSTPIESSKPTLFSHAYNVLSGAASYVRDTLLGNVTEVTDADQFPEAPLTSEEVEARFQAKFGRNAPVYEQPYSVCRRVDEVWITEHAARAAGILPEKEANSYEFPTGNYDTCTQRVLNLLYRFDANGNIVPRHS